MRALGFQGPPGNERRILILMYSLDALNWFQAGCVAMDRHPCHSFSYASQLIVGDDLLVLARTSQGGRNQHDTNMITLHRVRGSETLPSTWPPVWATEQRTHEGAMDAVRRWYSGSPFGETELIPVDAPPDVLGHYGLLMLLG